MTDVLEEENVDEEWIWKQIGPFRTDRPMKRSNSLKCLNISGRRVATIISETGSENDSMGLFALGGTVV